jgi:hypothetical protein
MEKTISTNDHESREAALAEAAEKARRVILNIEQRQREAAQYELRETLRKVSVA